MASPCVVTYKGKKYSYADYIDLMANGELDALLNEGVVSLEGIAKSMGNPALSDVESTAKALENKKAEIEKLENEKANLLKNNTSTSKKLTEKTPSKVSVYLSTPNSDGSFNKSSERKSFVEGASIFAFEPLGDNKFAVYLNKNESSKKLVLQYPDKNIDPIFEALAAFNPKSESIQTVKPAIVELQENRYVLIEMGQIDYDNVAIDRENSKSNSANTSKIDSKIEKAKQELKAVESLLSKEQPTPKKEVKSKEPITIKPASESQLATAIEKVFKLPKAHAKRAAKVIAQSAKGLIKAGVFADEKAFWDAFPTLSNERVGEITEAQQQGAKGMYRAAINFINALTNPDLSTPLHEISHWWLTVLDASANSGNKEAKRMLDAFNGFAKGAEGKKFWNKSFTGEFNANNYKFRQELFARSWEKYLYDGVVPPSLKKLFDGFMDFMKDIYKDLTDINIQLSPNMLVLFNGIMGEDMKFDQVPKTVEQAVDDLAKALDALEGLFQEPSNKKEEDGYDIKRLRQAEEQGRNGGGEADASISDDISGVRGTAKEEQEGNRGANEIALFQESQGKDAKAQAQDKIKAAAEKAVQAGLSKKEFIERIKSNPQAAKLFDVLSEKEVGAIYQQAASGNPTNNIEEVVNSIVEDTGLGTSPRRYIARGLDHYADLAYRAALQALGAVQKTVKQKLIEPIADKRFREMLASGDPAAAFTAFLYEATRFNPDAMMAGDDFVDAQSTADAMIFHKIIHYYQAQDNLEQWKYWTDVFARIGTRYGRFISAMQEAATPEAIANRKIEEIQAKRNEKLNEKQSDGRTGKDIVEDVKENVKTTKDEAQAVAAGGKATGKAKPKAAKNINNNKAKPIRITALSSKEKQEKAASAKSRLDKYKGYLKAKGLLQSPYTATKEMMDELSAMMDDVIGMGAKNKEEAMATFMNLLEGIGIKEADAQEIFDEIWDDATHGEAVKKEFSDYLANRVANVAVTQTKAKKAISDPIELLARALISKVSEIIPDATKARVKADSKKTSPYAKLAELIKNGEITEQAWRDAMKEVEERIKARTDMSAEEKSSMIAMMERYSE